MGLEKRMMTAGQRKRKREIGVRWHNVMLRMDEEPRLEWEAKGIRSMLRLNLLASKFNNRKSPVVIEQKIKAYHTAVEDAERAILRLETKEMVERGCELYDEAIAMESVYADTTALTSPNS